MSTNHAPFARRDERVWAPQAGAQTPDRSGPSSSPKRRSRRRVPTRLHLESLEDRSLPTATSLATLVSPLWFQDLTSAEDPLHAGPAAWSAASADEQAPALAGDDQTCDWIVRFDAAAATAISSLADTASLLVGSGVEFEVLRGLGLVGQVLVRSYGAPAAAVEDFLSSNQNVSAFERDGLRQLLAMPNDPMASQLWGLENTGQTGGTTDADLDAAAAWGLTTGSRVPVVAVVDTGIDWRHVDLAANVWTNPGEIAGNGIDDDRNGFVDDVHGYDFVNSDGDPMDDNGHGTHVAGTIAAVGNNGIGVSGVAWTSSLMGLKFLGRDGTGYTSDAVRAINYATMMRSRYGASVRVVNNSWGGSGYSSALAEAIQAAGNAGILCVAAAGNSGSNNDANPHYPSNYAASNVLAVAATDSRDRLATFSNYGAQSVDLAAPGVSILSTYPGNRYVTLSGTSMATPHVSGVAALAWSLAPNATVAEVRSAILRGVDRVGSLSGKVLSGGRLNASNTLRLLGNRPAQPPQIASLSATPNSLAAGTLATLTARGVTDPDGNVKSVSFYQDTNGNGQWDSTDRLLGTDATVVNGEASVTWSTAGLAQGTRRVLARAQDGSSLWSAAVSATLQIVAPDDHGNSAAAATAVSAGKSVAGRIDSGGDRDWFKLTAAAGTSYVFGTQLSTLADSVLTLYGRDGATVLVANDDAPGRGFGSEIRWTAPASGTYYLEVRAYSSSQAGAYALEIPGQNSPPTLAAITDRTMSTAQGAITVQLRATDANNDRLTFRAQVLPVPSPTGAAYELDQRLGLSSSGNYMQNYRGAQEKWMWGQDKAAYFLLPNGELHRWAGSVTSSPLVAALATEYWTNPRLLHDAQPATPAIPASAVALGLQGTLLTITPRAGRVGQFDVRVVVSDGVSTDTKTFRVTVAKSGAASSSFALPASSVTTLDPCEGPPAAPAIAAEAIDQLIAWRWGAHGGEPTRFDGEEPLRQGPPSVRSIDAALGREQWLAALAQTLEEEAEGPRGLLQGESSFSSRRLGSRSSVLADLFEEHDAGGMRPWDVSQRMLDESFAALSDRDLPTPEVVLGEPL